MAAPFGSLDQPFADWMRATFARRWITVPFRYAWFVEHARNMVLNLASLRASPAAQLSGPPTVKHRVQPHRAAGETKPHRGRSLSAPRSRPLFFGRLGSQSLVARLGEHRFDRLEIGRLPKWPGFAPVVINSSDIDNFSSLSTKHRLIAEMAEIPGFAA